jgi:hypothetical protein
MEKCENVNDLAKSMTVLDAINFAFQSNRKLSASCIKKCFKICGFPMEEEDLIDHDKASRTPNIELKNIMKVIYNGNMFSADEYIEIDNQVYTENDDINLKNIAEIVTEDGQVVGLNDLEDLGDEDEDIVISSLEALKCLEKLEIYSKNSGDHNFYNKIVDLKAEHVSKIVSLKKKYKTNHIVWFLKP